MLYPLLFEPNLHTVVWGGQRLRPYKGLVPDGKPIGESWEVSAVPGSTSVISNGAYSGQPLSDVIALHTEEVLGRSVARRYGGQLPLLVKFIDAEKDLSIQVHPDDTMAQHMHGKWGKSEMWYIIDAEPGSCLYAGFKSPISPYEYKKRVEDGSITDVLARHEVHPGDVFYLPAGRVHAICGGIRLAEVQQSSDVTYRIFDYNRPGADGKPRQLHTDLARQAIDYKVYDDYKTEYAPEADKAVEIVSCPYFTTSVLDLRNPMEQDLSALDTFVVAMCLEGYGEISAEGETISIKADEVVLIPATAEKVSFKPGEDGFKLLTTRL